MYIERFIEHNLLIVTPHTPLSEAIALMSQKQTNRLSDCVLIVTQKQLRGILTQSDVIKSIAAGKEPSAIAVQQVMTQPVITIQKSQCDRIQAVWSILQQNSISYLPIVGENRAILGVITLKSLLKSLTNREKKQKNNHTPLVKHQTHFQQTPTKLERLFDVTPSMLCIAGFDGYFRRLNANFTEILGFTKEELLDKSLLDFVHPEDRMATLAEMKKLAQGNTTFSFENRYRTKNGNYRWFLWTAKPYVQEQVIYAAAQDITERKETEITLRESEKRWQLALRGANDGIWDWNVQTDEVFFSRRWKEMLGFREDEIGNSLDEWSKRVHPDDLERVSQLIQEHFTKKTPFYISEHRVLCKDGTYKWILDRGQALWDSEGNIVRMAGSHTDISDRKAVEQQLQQERDFSNAVIDTVGALIAVLDRYGKIVSFNHTCEQVTGYEYAEIQDKKIWDILVAPEEKATVKAVFERLLTGQVPNQYTNYWLGKDGTRHLISWSNTALFDHQGTVSFIIATGIDITEQRRVWNKLEHQYRQTKLLAEITRKIRMSIDIESILQTTVTEVQHLLNCDRVLIVTVGANNTAIPISEAVLRELTPMLGYEITDPLLVGEYLTKYHQGEILAINNLAMASIASEIKQLLQQFQIQAKLVVPILSHNQLKGLLVAHQCHNPRNWQDNEIQLLTQLANQIGVALSQAQLLDNLESMVKERTLELTTTNQLLEAEIVEREQTEAALRENQQKLEGILDNADEAIITIDEQQKIQLFNRGAEKIFGYKVSEVIGQSLDLLIPQALRDLHRQHIEQFSQSAVKSRTMAERNSNVLGMRKNGTQFPAEASIAKLETREGILLTVMLKDITERQQAREKLESSRSLLAKAEKIAKIGSWEYNFATQELTWSEELYEILGFPQKNAIPPCQEIFNRIYPADLSLVKNTLRKAHQEGLPWHFNYRCILPNGTIKHLETRGEPTRNGQVMKIWGTVMDISQRIQAEKSLQRSEEQLKLITDGLPVLIAYIDRQQRYVYNNRTYETWFGKPRSALLGLKIADLVSEDEYRKMLPYIEMVLSGKVVTFEIQSTDEKGHLCWMSATYIPDFDVSNQVKGFFSMIDDITDRKQIEKIKSEFVSVASHEMRTPLTSIHGVIKLLSAGRLGELSPAGKEMAKMALKNSDRLVNLINDILDLERLESGKDRIDIQDCHSQELIQQAIEALDSMAQKQHITLQNNSQSIPLVADRDRIIQTLINLLSNAIKYSPDESTIEVTCQSQGNNVLFAVKDRGRGIPQDKLEAIFERFQQVDASDSRKKGGTGLGLAICRHIVEQHGGKIWVESIYGEGSTFFFTIPRKS